MQEFLQYTEFILAIGLVLMCLFLMAMVLVMWLGSIKTKNDFFKAARKSLEFPSVIESMKGITNDFEVYKSHWFGFANRTIIELCQELEQKMKSEDVQTITVLKLEEIISLYKDDYRFDDEKMNEVIENIRKKASEEDARKTREYLIKVDAFNRGIIHEKESNLKEIQNRLERRKWFNRFCGFIGLIGSVASIYSIFK